MATPPFTIDESIPGNADLISAHPAAARTFRDVVEDYINTDHDFNTGHHAKVGLVEQAANPGTVAATGWVFTKAVSGKSELFYMDSAGTVKQLTSNGIILLAATDIAINSVDGTKLALGGDTTGDLMVYDGTNWVRLPAAATGLFLKSLGVGVLPAYTAIDTPTLLVFEDQKASGVVGDTLVANAWTKHTLNTAQFGGGSLAASVISLPAGTYDASGFVMRPQSNGTRVRLQNTTDGATLILGQTWGIGAPATTATTIPAGFSGGFTITATKNVELQYYTNVASAVGTDLTTSGAINVYAQAKLLRLGA